MEIQFENKNKKLSVKFFKKIFEIIELHRIMLIDKLILIVFLAIMNLKKNEIMVYLPIDCFKF